MIFDILRKNKIAILLFILEDIIDVDKLNLDITEYIIFDKCNITGLEEIIFAQ